MAKTSLEGAVAIVTGGSVGYGYGIAQVLKARGARVWITARRAERLEAAAEELGVRAVAADVTVPGDWDRVVQSVLEDAGRVDLLINNAGAGIHIAPLVELSDEDIAACVATNLTGVMYGCRRVAPLLKEQGSGTIINISSICDQQAWPGFSIYGAAKAGLLSFSNHLHVELREFGVRVTCLTPSWGDTDFTVALGKERRPEDVRRKVTQPEELGEIVAQVCELPAHLVMPTLMVLPLVQEIVPF
ncbi:MAG: SDR family oxidoreductase [Armatimonadetes bacterium]|nr:SDR family oxidoreductase [Armatimonadota bacterium]